MNYNYSSKYLSSFKGENLLSLFSSLFGGSTYIMWCSSFVLSGSDVICDSDGFDIIYAATSFNEFVGSK